VPALLDPIRHQVLRENIQTREAEIPAFHRAFLKTVRMFGRVHELTLIGMYKMKTRTYFNDMRLGLEMFRKGKMHILPHRSKRSREIKEVFNRSSVK
jgi:ABC-type phosphate transport system auxiliary subunit